MRSEASSAARAALLLSAPLLGAGGDRNAALLAPAELRRLTDSLAQEGGSLAALAAGDSGALSEARRQINEARLDQLLKRDSLLNEALERWSEAGIWCAAPGDREYPRRLTERMGRLAPALIYGSGNSRAADGPGIAVVGSRAAGEEQAEAALTVGAQAAGASVALVSGGARGIDQAAMRGALDAGGKAVGVLADSLARTLKPPENAEAVEDGRLLLLSPYDPLAGFNVGNAMQRNKLIYALADAALVVCSEVGAGGTWSGAVEQLEKLRYTPVYVLNGDSPGLQALLLKGARMWPGPRAADALRSFLMAALSWTAEVQPALDF